LTKSAPTHIPTFDPPDEPVSLDDALSGPDAHLWKQASDREMASHIKNTTFTIVPRPTDYNVVSTKFVWKLKNPHTDTPTYKARLVACGFFQIPGVDYDQTFSPVPKTTTVHFMFANAAGGKRAHHFDIETAFLESDIDKVIYAEQPVVYLDPKFPPDEYVLLLNKGIPGLKQGAFLWSTKLKGTLTQIGFVQSDADECLYIRCDVSGTTICTT
jgi:hypothetical protein